MRTNGRILAAGLFALAVMVCVTGTAQCDDGKMEGWANVPGGVVYLRPGIDAYEHDTGLVRDTRTGQKSLPITPQSVQPLAHQQPSPYPHLVTPLPTTPPPPVYNVPRNPYNRNIQPIYVQPNYTYPPGPYYYSPQPVYDLGPGNVYGSGCNGTCGVKLGSPGSINARWPQVQSK